MIAALAMLGAALAQEPQQIAADAEPLPAYLSARQIRDALAGAGWQPCVDQHPPGEAVTGQLAVTVAADGTLEGARWAGVPEPLAACWSAVVAGVALPAHDEEPLAVGWTLAVREGTVFPYPVVQLTERSLAPLFLFVSPDATPAQRQALREALGFSADEGATYTP